jgi:hypothetical protein
MVLDMLGQEIALESLNQVLDTVDDKPTHELCYISLPYSNGLLVLLVLLLHSFRT